MHKDYLIALNEFCTSHNIEISFISSLEESGLIEITTIQETGFIEADQLQQLERFIRLFFEMDINLEGIETITNLLERIKSMHAENIRLKNKLLLYENGL